MDPEGAAEMTVYPTDQEVLAFIEATERLYPAGAIGLSVQENRDHYDRLTDAFRGSCPAEVAVDDRRLSAAEPARELAARRYRHVTARCFPDVTFLYLHGGGFLLGGLDSHDDVCADLCARTGLDVAALDYRLAPEHPFPAALDDTEAAHRSLLAEGSRVIVGGDSAGGNLAAALCLRAAARNFARPIGQLLIYPALGGDPDQGSYLEHAAAPLLSREDCIAYFAAYGGEAACGAGAPPEIAPLNVQSFEGLPPAAVFSADIDPLRDDAARYAECLRAAGVEASYRNEPELVHGYLRARHASRRAAAGFDAICRAALWLAGGGPRPAA